MSQIPAESVFQIPSDEANATLTRILQANAGLRVAAEFVIGTEETATRTGILTSATSEYLVLQDPDSQTSTVCDVRTLQFVRFFPPQAGASVDEIPPVPNAPSVQPVSAGYRSQSQAAFNYARRKSQRLE